MPLTRLIEGWAAVQASFQSQFIYSGLIVSTMFILRERESDKYIYLGKYKLMRLGYGPFPDTRPTLAVCNSTCVL